MELLQNSEQDYRILRAQMEALAETDGSFVPLLANVSALLYDFLQDVNWVGFYIVRKGRLVLGPFQGKPACIHIDFGKGVCGKAIQENQNMLVEDVHLFPGHIACDAASRAELVLVLRNRQGEAVALLDIDSPLKGRFTKEEERELDAFCRILEEKIIWEW